nr:Notch [Cucujiformia]
GFQGQNCEIKVNFCANSPCQNGGICTPVHAGHKCTCREGFYGKNCEFSGYDCDSNPCSNGGKCSLSDGGGYICECPVGLTGTHCELDSLNECSSNPCKHPDATCQDKLGDYLCFCPATRTGKSCEGFQGQNCEIKVNFCANSPCQNGGICTPVHAGHKCTCREGFYGKNCEFSGYDCDSNPCSNGGKCSLSDGGGYICECPVGLTGTHCELDSLNECSSNPCKHPDATCQDKLGDYLCFCPATRTGKSCEGFQGQNCEIKVNFCANSPCQNGGICTPVHAGHKCTCREGFYGKNCEFSGYDCDSNPCSNGGKCSLSDGGGYICECPVGLTGTHCELDSLNECSSNPCKHPDATCQDKLGDYLCFCPATRTGKSCEIYDPNASAGYGQEVRVRQDINMFYMKDLERQRQECLDNKCPLKRGNFKCDEECNKYACDFDGNDCSLGINNPWVNCTAAIRCWEVFMDGVCNPDCNNAACLFDGRDCEKSLQPCNPIYDAYCQKHYANGHCDYGCDNRGFQGQNCEIKVNFCANSPCQNGGICTPVHAGHKCTCREGFYGKNCEFSGYDCDSNPCSNGGKCSLSDGGGYICECPVGLTGTHCEL